MVVQHIASVTCSSLSSIITDSLASALSEAAIGIAIH
jgi:hypothetical protein